MKNGTIELARRDTLEKFSVSLEGIVEVIAQNLVEIQDNLFKRAVDFREYHTTEVDTFEDFKKSLEQRRIYFGTLGRYS